VVHHYLLVMIGGFLTVEGDPDLEAEDAFWIPLSRLRVRLSYPNEQKLGIIADQLLRDNPAVLLPEGGAGDAPA